MMTALFERLEAGSDGFDGVAISGPDWEKLKYDMSKETVY